MDNKEGKTDNDKFVKRSKILEYMKTGVELIGKERDEQIDKHGRTIGKDLHDNKNFQLAIAASALCQPDVFESKAYDKCPDGWNINIWNKMCSKGYFERVIISGALLAAEADRLQNQ